jgi:ATP-dependent Zn protease
MAYAGTGGLIVHRNQQSGMSERWLTSAHEAGHVVVALALGYRIRKVMLFPDNDSAGKYWFQPLDYFRLLFRKEDHARIIMAGSECEKMFFPESKGSGHDTRELADLYLPEETLSRCRWEVRGLLKLHREEIEKLARDLCENGEIKRL